MRLIIGIILGIALTVGGAFISDTLRPAAGSDGVEAKPMVNWDVVGQKCKNVSTELQDAWNRLTNR